MTCSCTTIQKSNDQDLVLYPHFFRTHFLKSHLTKKVSPSIEEVCSLQNSIPTPNKKLRNLLADGQNYFLTPEARLKAPEKYLEALDLIIAASEYHFLLQCRDQWKATPGQSFQLIFSHSSKTQHIPMSLNGEAHLELVVDLHPSFQRTLLTYMHELLHICQSQRSQSLEKNRSLEGKSEYNRFRFLMEIEAQALMVIAFEDLIRYSPRLCRDENPKVSDQKMQLQFLYQEGKNEILNGTFSQRVISWYQEPFQNILNAVFLENSHNTVYEKSILGSSFQMKCLHPVMIKDLKMSGFRVQQGSGCDE